MTTIKVDFDALMGFGKTYRTLAESIEHRAATIYGFDANKIQLAVNKYELDIRTTNSHFVGQTLPVISADAQARNTRVAKYLMSCSTDLFNHAGQTNIRDDNFNWAGSFFSGLGNSVIRTIRDPIFDLVDEVFDLPTIFKTISFPISIIDYADALATIRQNPWGGTFDGISATIGISSGLIGIAAFFGAAPLLVGALPYLAVAGAGIAAFEVSRRASGAVMDALEDKFDFSGAFQNSVIAREGKSDLYEGVSGMYRWFEDGVLNTADFFESSSTGAKVAGAYVPFVGPIAWEAIDGWAGGKLDSVFDTTTSTLGGIGGAVWGGANSVWDKYTGFGQGVWDRVFGSEPPASEWGQWTWLGPLSLSGNLADIIRDALKKSTGTNKGEVRGPGWDGKAAVPKEGGPSATKKALSEPGSELKARFVGAYAPKPGSKYDKYNTYYNALGNCTSYVAWRLNDLARQAGSSWTFSNNNIGDISVARLGDAHEWGANAGDEYLPDETPAPGAVAWWDKKGGKGSLGHVGVVRSIDSNGVITVEESAWPAPGNTSGDGLFSIKTYAPGDADYPTGFLHLLPGS